MLYILNEKYLVPKYITSTDCNSLWLHGKKYRGYLLHNVTPFAINSSDEAFYAFMKKLINELLLVFDGANKGYLTGYKYKVTKAKIYDDKKNWPKLELLIGQGVDVNSPLALNVDYLKKNNFNYYTLIENGESDIIINWELLLYLLKKLDKAFTDNMILSKLIDTLNRFNIPSTLNSKLTPGGPRIDVTSVPLHWAYNPVHTVYQSLTDNTITYNLLCIRHQILFNYSPNILYKLCPSKLRNKCIKQIKKVIRTELQNVLALIG